MPKEIRKFQCDYCRRSYMRHRAACEHEVMCWYNADRVPREGELAIYEKMPRALLVNDSYGVPGSDFYSITEEPEVIAKFKWWPTLDGEIDLGYFWKDGKWEKIPGYKWPHLAPGFSFKPEVIPDSPELNSRFN